MPANSGCRGLRHRAGHCRLRFWKRNALRTGELAYIDSSALVKIFVDEPESTVLREYLEAWPTLSSCVVARVEVARAAKLHQLDVYAVERFLQSMSLVELTDDVLAVAAELASASLRSLDAIHLAAASTLRPRLATLVTYDRRMAMGASELGLPVVSPGWATA